MGIVLPCVKRRAARGAILTIVMSREEKEI